MVSVEKSRYTIAYDSEEDKPEIKKHNLDKIEVIETETPRKIIFEANTVPTIKAESLSPLFRDIAPRLAVRLKKFNLKGQEASVSNWSELGTWMNTALLKDRDVLDEATIAKAKNLV